MVNIAYKYRIYPNTEQKIFFAKCFGCVRFFYNKSLKDMNKYYKENNKFKDITPSTYKKEFPFLKEVDSLALANAQLNRNKAFKAFFNKKAKFPRFKSKKDNQAYTSNNQNGTVSISKDNKYISLPKIKNIRIKLHRKFNGEIKNVTISKNGINQYFISILVIEDKPIIKSTSNKSVGIDLGVKEYLIDSNNKHIDNNKFYLKQLNKLKLYQQKLSKCRKNSSNYRKMKYKINKLHIHITNKRNDFLHKLSSSYVNDNQVIVTEDLKIMNMEQDSKVDNKYILDASWSKFISMINYKAKLKGKIHIKVPSNYPSSQLCSCCGFKNENIKNLSIRKWICPKCNKEHNRDYNASINILNEGLRILKRQGQGQFASEDMVTTSIFNHEEEAPTS